MTKCLFCGHTVEYAPYIGKWLHTANTEEYLKNYVHICSNECGNRSVRLCSYPIPESRVEYLRGIKPYYKNEEEYIKFRREVYKFYKKMESKDSYESKMRKLLDFW